MHNSEASKMVTWSFAVKKAYLRYLHLFLIAAGISEENQSVFQEWPSPFPSFLGLKMLLLQSSNMGTTYVCIRPQDHKMITKGCYNALCLLFLIWGTWDLFHISDQLVLVVILLGVWGSLRFTGIWCQCWKQLIQQLFPAPWTCKIPDNNNSYVLFIVKNLWQDYPPPSWQAVLLAVVNRIPLNTQVFFSWCLK